MMFLRRWRAGDARVIRLDFRHVERMAELHAGAFARGWSADEIENLLASPGSEAIGARLGSALLGMVLARVAAGEAEILTVAVDPDWRGCGLGRRLMTHAMERAAGRGATEMFLEVEEGNAPARALYRNLGFVDAGRRKGYYRGEGGGDAIIMRRALRDVRPFVLPPDAVEFPSGSD